MAGEGKLASLFLERSNFFKVVDSLASSGSIEISLDEIFNSLRLGHWETSDAGKVVRPVEVRLMVFNCFNKGVFDKKIATFLLDSRFRLSNRGN